MIEYVMSSQLQNKIKHDLLESVVLFIINKTP
jgi:hypothetical protein